MPIMSVPLAPQKAAQTSTVMLLFAREYALSARPALASE
jgi:hypothetical protein